uniref:Uncharacterized protein n=1 Tax=Setaria italica TaxID=4555 RepID=K3ZFY2_SETIT
MSPFFASFALVHTPCSRSGIFKQPSLLRYASFRAQGACEIVLKQ